MHVDKIGVVPVDLHHLVLVLTVHVDVVVGADVLVGQDCFRRAELVAWGIHVLDLQVAGFLLLIHLEEEVFFRDHLIVSTLRELFPRDLIFELNEANFLLDNLVDSLANRSKMLGAACLTEGLVGAWHSRVFFEGVQISGLRLFLFGGLLHRLGGVLPQCLHEGVAARLSGGLILTDSCDLAGESTLAEGVCTLAQQHLKHLVLSTDHI